MEAVQTGVGMGREIIDNKQVAGLAISVIRRCSFIRFNSHGHAKLNSWYLLKLGSCAYWAFSAGLTELLSKFHPKDN